MVNNERNDLTYGLEQLIDNDELLYDSLVEIVQNRGIKKGVCQFVDDLYDELMEGQGQARGLVAYAIEEYVQSIEWDGLKDDLVEDMRELFPGDEEEEEEEEEEAVE